MLKNIVVAGIGTDVGKTVASAILAKVFQADYWKPISCGSDDSIVVRNLGLKVHPEVYTLPYSISPHANPGTLDPEKLQLPTSSKPLIIEMAGGVLVPFDEETLCIDHFSKWEADWALVISDYIGNINHSLLSLEALQSRGVSFLGIIFNGERNEASERVILSKSGLKVIGRIEPEKEINCEVIQRYSEKWKLV